MYHQSRHANWLLTTLFLTLLVSSLILGWLLTRSTVFASSQSKESPSIALQRETTAKPLIDTAVVPAVKVQPAATTTQATDPLLLAERDKTIAPDTLAVSPTKPKSSSSLEAQQLAMNLIEHPDLLLSSETLPKPLVPLASLAMVDTDIKPAKTPAPDTLTSKAFEDFAKTNIRVPTLSQAQTGWIYAGQFQNGHWVLSGLNIPEGNLPSINTSYKLTWGAKVRAAPPKQKSSGSTDNLAESIGYLAVGSSIQVLNVKQSGKNGHIWLEISY